MTVYPDLALILGLVVYGFVYGLSVRLLDLRRPRWQISLCVFLSALAAAVAVLPSIPSVFLFLFGMGVTFVLFRGKTPKGTILNGLTVIGVLLLYLGFWGAISAIMFSLSVIARGSGVYLLLSFGESVVAAIFAGMGVRLFLRFRKKRAASFSPVDCEVDLEGATVLLRCYPDSGNFLTDPVSGFPVVIVEYNALCRRVTPPLPRPMTYEFAARFGKRARVIPCRSVSESGQMLSAFVPDGFRVNGISRSVVIAVVCRPLDARGRFCGIIGPDVWKGE